MLEDGELALDAAHVLLPADLHARAASALIGRSLHVLLEKPMAITAKECSELIEQAAARGVMIGVDHNFLFAPTYENLNDDLKSGKIGRPDHVTITLWMLRDPRNIILESRSEQVVRGRQEIRPGRLHGGGRAPRARELYELRPLLDTTVGHRAFLSGRAGARRNQSHQLPPPAKTEVADFHELWGWQALEGGNVDTARKHAPKSLIVAPFSMNAWKLFSNIRDTTSKTNKQLGEKANGRENFPRRRNILRWLFQPHPALCIRSAILS